MSAILKLVLGFVAGAIGVLVFHQGMYLILNLTGAVPNPAWRMAPVPPYGVPTIVNQMFWGGLWGAGFGLLYNQIPGGGIVKGMIFGMLGPMLLGSWLVVALIKGQPILSGFLTDYNVLRLRNGFLLNGIAFGIGLGLLYPALKGLFGQRA